MKPQMLLILGIFLGFALIEIARSNFFRKPGQTRDDAILEAVSTLTLTGFTQPFILFAAVALLGALAPGLQGALAGLPFVAGFALFLVFDDMTQYWWHRAAHTFPWLYPLHRPHHNGSYMSVRLVYRNNLFYYLLMPGLWLSGALIYLGFGWVYAVYVVMKMTVIIAAHSDVRWDRPLYENRLTAPLMWIVERTISTPATHHAHHGKHKSDGVTNYKGNYGNFLFFWDVLFGTAKITRQYPPEFGVENMAPTTLAEQLAWPLFRAPKQAAAPAPAE